MTAGANNAVGPRSKGESWLAGGIVYSGTSCHLGCRTFDENPHIFAVLCCQQAIEVIRQEQMLGAIRL